ncbi:MAG: hypothetical protein R3F48_09670 [Candidatus Zixiibacteriota bacterium]
MKLILIIVVLLVVCTGTIFGIDRAKKETNPKPDSAQTAQPAAPPQDTGGKGKTDNFDKFIDNNKNGIDDRAEKNKPTQTKKTTADTATTKSSKP